MLAANELAAYAALAASVGTWLLKVDRWAHSPASLKEDIDRLVKRFDLGNERFSEKMGEVTAKDDQLHTHINAVDLRVTRLEALEEARSQTPRPRMR